ncbi:hypothetical protein [Hymenobacter lapidiphilus]|uniref:Uncharacterized protein n=1 Tax=Hymenobacter lapidiphilus TaxID=2608003 RepID=A0A7Y7PM82_9BACT|nr:hypothetical protein [Hymenobacter lapidiphilus]NVO30368.1 hypothetical protein [Hymenobacter lapidiphilus]
MTRSPNLFFALATLILLTSAGLRFIDGANMRWAPSLMIFGFCFLAAGFVRYRRNQQENEQNHS